jgi:hypothetical protein
MYYIVCPTCKDLLASKYIPYTKELTELCKSKHIDPNYMSLHLKDDIDFRDKSANILKKYFRNMCCRQYVMNAIDVAELIQ